MPRYITISDLRDEMPDVVQGLLTNDTANTVTKVDEIIEQKIEAAEQEVESYLAARYALPVSAPDGTVPVIIKQAIYTITKYYLYGRRNQIDAGIADQYAQIVKWLNRVKSAELDVPLILADGASATTFVTVQTGGFSAPQFESFL